MRLQAKGIRQAWELSLGLQPRWWSDKNRFAEKRRKHYYDSLRGKPTKP